MGWLGYDSRVYGYVYLLYDPYPAFGTDGEVPMRSAWYAEPANRLTNGLRFIWIIPAAIILLILASPCRSCCSSPGSPSCSRASSTGRDVRLHDERRALHGAHGLSAYGLMMTDTYPRYDGVTPTTRAGAG